MAQKEKIKDDIKPSATPTDDDVGRWQALPRDEQLKRMRRVLQEGVDSGVSERSMDDIKADALKRLAARKND